MLPGKPGESMVERFHIAEWYGRPYLDLADSERVEFAKHRVGGSVMTKKEMVRRSALKAKAGTANGLTARERQRLVDLDELLEKQRRDEKLCPFRTDMEHATCNKPGGVCSLRVYTDEHGPLQPVGGERGMIRALCPYRFHQDDTIFRHIGQGLLQDPSPVQVGEVGFLSSTGNLDSAPGDDVGRIDMILVKGNAADGHPMDWAAVEIQAVYFSGKEMKIEFDDIRARRGAVAHPVEARRPDYRSSGPKRLMPQLQIKVPTLRRWGKKVAIVVDVPFFLSMGEMREVEHVSNADIVWFLVDFVQAPGDRVAHARVVREVATTLEGAIEGLTGGEAVSLEVFEERIRGKSGIA